VPTTPTRSLVVPWDIRSPRQLSCWEARTGRRRHDSTHWRRVNAEDVTVRMVLPNRRRQRGRLRPTAPYSHVRNPVGPYSRILGTNELWRWVNGIVEGVDRKVEFGMRSLVDGRTLVVCHFGDHGARVGSHRGSGSRTQSGRAPRQFADLRRGIGRWQIRRQYILPPPRQFQHLAGLPFWGPPHNGPRLTANTQAT
jgi:hypothetical protein